MKLIFKYIILFKLINIYSINLLIFLNNNLLLFIKSNSINNNL